MLEILPPFFLILIIAAIGKMLIFPNKNFLKDFLDLISNC